MPILQSKQDFNLKLFLNTRRYLLLAIALVFGGAALVGFAIIPQIRAAFATRENLSKERQYYESLVQKLNELQQIELSAEFEQKDRVNEVLPSKKPVLEILFNLNQGSRQHDITIKELDFAPGKIATEAAETAPETARINPYSSLKLNLSISGQGEDVDKFLELIEQIAPITTIVELEADEVRTTRYAPVRFDEDVIQAEAEAQERVVVEANMVLDIYYYTNVIATSIDARLPSVEEDQMRVFETIQKFRPTEFEQPTEIQSSDIEDLFGIEGFDFGID